MGSAARQRQGAGIQRLNTSAHCHNTYKDRLMNRWTSRWICGVLAAWLALTMLTPVRAAGEAGWQTADAIQKALQQAQLTLSNADTGAATQLVGQAERAATRDLLPVLSSDDATA